MKSGNWILAALGSLLLSSSVVVGSSYALDIFGIFHDSKGKQLAVEHNERTAKLLLNVRYVPSNFDALLVGGSSTSNWRMSALDFASFYNESLYGSNNAEEKRLVDEALAKGQFRYAICLINPYMLQSHEFHEGGGESPRREALGSVNLLREEFYGELRRTRGTPSPYWPDGGSAMPATTGIVDPFLSYTFQYDPIALRAFQQMLDELRSKGTRIIFLETPVYEPVYEKHRAEFDRFYASFPLRREDEPLIDFNLPKYAEFRSDPSRWVDPPHLNDASAVLASEELNKAIHNALPALEKRP